VEQEEEYITNKLMKRLEQLKKEKQLLATEVRAAPPAIHRQSEASLLFATAELLIWLSAE
jgi:hypothetical protein